MAFFEYVKCTWSFDMKAAVWTSLNQFTVTSSTETFWQKKSEREKNTFQKILKKQEGIKMMMHYI